MANVQEARVELSEAVVERIELPPAMGTDEARIAALLSLADTLDAVAAGFAALPLGPDVERGPRFPLPAPGTVLRTFGERDAAGIARPGLVLSLPAETEVTAPVAATVRHAGPLLDYGNVIVLEPRAGTQMVFAGLTDVYHPAGTVVAAGEVLGRMGGRLPGAVDFLRQTVTGGGVPSHETLYIEFRQDGTPVDPAEHFAIEQGRPGGEDE